MRNALGYRWSVLLAGVAMLLALAACSQAEPEVVEVIKEVVVEKEVIKEVEVPGETVVVEKEVIKEVEVPGETVVVEKEVVKEVEVEVLVEKEVVKVVEVPGETVFVEKESPKEKTLSKPVYGGTLRVALDADPGGKWDMCEFKAQHMLQYVAENFLIGDYSKGPAGTGETTFQPFAGIGSALIAHGAVADTWHFPDPLTYSFHVRPGIKWQDKHPTFGRPVTAEELAAELNRIKTCRWPRQDFLPKGDEAVTADDTDGDGKADTVTYHTVKPISFWGYEMAWGPYFMLVPPESVEAGTDNWENQSGTGAWFAAGYVPASTVTFERNPNWYQTWTVEGREYGIPYLDKVVNIIIPQEATRIASLRTAKLDHLQGVRTVDRPDLEERLPELKKSLAIGKSFSYYLPMNKPPFDDIKVRRAMQMAIDREVFSNAFHGGQSILYGWPLSPSFPAFYTPLQDQPESVRENYTYNPEMAEQLLDEAGMPRGADGTRFSVELMINNENQVELEAAELAVGFWDDIGVKVTLDINDRTQWVARLFENDYEMFAENSDARPTIMNDFRAGHQWNKPNMNDEKWWALWEDVLTTIDPVDQAENVKKAATYYLELAAGVHTPAGYDGDYWHPWLLNHHGERALAFADPGSRWAYVWIDRELRQQETGFKD